MLETRVVLPICEEIRDCYRLPDASSVPITDVERDAVWGLQGQILYISIRRYIYSQSIGAPEVIADNAVDVFLSGISAVALAASGGSRNA
ncbi:MAG: hypothetical protein JF585_03695 [Burkholderiales bacterium]|nr:hypothetical protein [Burkholderiales bacterium]